MNVVLGAVRRRDPRALPSSWNVSSRYAQAESLANGAWRFMKCLPSLFQRMPPSTRQSSDKTHLTRETTVGWNCTNCGSWEWRALSRCECAQTCTRESTCNHHENGSQTYLRVIRDEIKDEVLDRGRQSYLNATPAVCKMTCSVAAACFVFCLSLCLCLRVVLWCVMLCSVM